MPKPITILAIETSCDETGVAIVERVDGKVRVLSESVASQADVHALTGGVVPEVAAREHVAVLRPLIHDVLSASGKTRADLTAIAVTVGPGLQPALAVGVMAARTLCMAWNKPIIPIHHLEGHIYSALLQGEILFPALALLVSGGHTLLVKIPAHTTYEVLGSTCDDAAGEAFDKVARLLNLPYPGGPPVSKLAKEGNSKAYKFPRPMLNSGDLDFSFSGLKTAVLYALRELPSAEKEAKRADVAASFEKAIVDTLVTKTSQAIEQESPAVLLLAGGVAANELLREELAHLAKSKNIELRVAPLSLCGDNATMIGQAAVWAYDRGRLLSWQEVDAKARLDLSMFTNVVQVRDLIKPKLIA